MYTQRYHHSTARPIELNVGGKNGLIIVKLMNVIMIQVHNLFLFFS